MRFAVVDMDAAPEHISAAWNERDRAQDIADDLNREHCTQRYVVLPIEQRKENL